MNTRVLALLLLVALLIPAAVTPVSAATESQIDQAIEDGLDWLASQQNGDGSFGMDPLEYYRVANTAAAVLAFENEGHFPGGGTAYSDEVEAGLDYLFQFAYIYAIGPQPAGDPDTNGNGLGVSFYTAEDLNREVYLTGMIMQAIVASNTPMRLVTTGLLTDWTYEEVMEDLVDWAAWGQVDSGTGRGGWRYYANFVNSDNSTAQWPVLGLIAAEQWGISAPQFVKDELNIWIDYIQNDTSGGSGYSTPTETVNMAKTGALLIEMYYVGDDKDTPRVQAALGYLDGGWSRVPSGWEGNLGHPYAMFSIFKGLELLGVATIPSAPAHPPDSEAGDWYGDYADFLVNSQSGGTWPGYWHWTGPLATGWNIVILQATIFPVEVSVDVPDCACEDDEYAVTVTYSVERFQVDGTLQIYRDDVLYATHLLDDFIGVDVWSTTVASDTPGNHTWKAILDASVGDATTQAESSDDILICETPKVAGIPDQYALFTPFDLDDYLTYGGVQPVSWSYMAPPGWTVTIDGDNVATVTPPPGATEPAELAFTAAVDCCLDVVCSSSDTAMFMFQTDLAVIKTGPTEAEAGAELTYLIELHNNGPSAAENVVLVETLPAGTSFVSIEAMGFPPGLGAFCPLVDNTLTCDISAYLATFLNPQGAHPPGVVLPIELRVLTDPAFCYTGKINNYVAVSTSSPDVDLSNNDDDWGTVIFNVTNLEIRKAIRPTVGPPLDPLIAGETADLVLTIKNLGPGCATDVTVVDQLHSHTNAPNLALLKFASTSSDPAVPPFYYGWYSCSGAASCTRGAPLPPEIEDEIILTVGVAPDTPPAVYVNSATVTWNSASAETSLAYRVEDKAMVEVSKDDLWDPVIVGALGEESIVYVVTVENNGPSTARDVIVTDDLPSGTQLGDDVIVVPSYAPLLPAVCSGPGSNPVVCALGDMPAGSTAELYLAIQVTDVALCDSMVTNNVSVDWTDFFGGAVASPGQDEFSTVTDLLCQGDLDLKKTGNRVVAVGADLDYVLRVTNTGPSPIPAGEVTLEDVIPSGLAYVSFLSSGPCEWSGGPPVWTNLQPFPAGTECRLEIKTTVTEAATTDIEKGVIFNEAQVHDLDGNMDQAVWLTKVDRSTTLALTKQLVNPDSLAPLPPGTGLVAGTEVGFLLEVRNDGDVTAYDVELTDNLVAPLLPTGARIVAVRNPDGVDLLAQGVCTASGFCNLGDLAPAATARIVVTVALDADQRGRDLTQAACVEADNAAVACAEFSSTIVANADVTMAKHDMVDPAIIGALGSENTILYVVTLQNQGPSHADDVVVTDLLPPGMSFVEEWLVTASYADAPDACTDPCDLGRLPAGATAELIIVVQVNDPALCGMTVTNQAGVSWQDDFGGGNLSADEETAILCSANLSLSKSGPDNVGFTDAVNTGFSYALQVGNLGPSAIAVGALKITELLPAELEYVGILAQTGVCNFTDPGPAAGPSSLDFISQGELVPGQSCQLDIQVRLKNEPALCEDGIIFNRALATVDDSTQDQAQASHVTQLTCQAEFSVTKQGPAAVTPGVSSPFTIVVRNDGPDPACGVEIQDLPVNFAYVLTSLSQASSTQPGVSLIAATDHSVRADQCMPVGTVHTLELDMFFPPDLIEPPSGDPFLNCASVVADTPFDSDLTNACWQFDLTRVADLALAKTALAETVGPDRLLGFHIEVVNQGPSDIIGPEATFGLTDLLEGPAEIVAISKAACVLDPPDDPARPYYDSATCSDLELDVGDKLDILISTRVDPYALPLATVTNTATIAVISGFNDPDLGDNVAEATATVTVDEFADLSVRKYVKPDTLVKAGLPFTYTIFVDNMGPSNAINVRLEDSLFADGQFEVLGISSDRDGAGATCGTASGDVLPSGPVNPMVLVCELDALEVFGRWTINVVVMARSEIDINNDVRVFALEPLDPDLNDNMDSATALVRSADMRMQCGATLACVCPGDVFRYTVRLFNDGTATAENVTVSLTLPPEVTYIGDSIGCGPGLTDCPLGAIQPGTYVDFEVEVGVDASAVDMDELEAGIAAARADSSEILEGTVVLSVDQAARKYLPLIVLEPTD